MNFDEKKHCPVCSMIVLNSSISHDYWAIEYWFCSNQCKNRFIDHPHIYVGDPKFGLSEKQKGKVVMKARRIRLSEKLGENNVNDLIEAISTLMGVDDIDIDDTDQDLTSLIVAYDLMQVSFDVIQQLVIDRCGDLKESLPEKMRRSIIRYTEECELDNLGHLTKINGHH